MLQLIPNTLNKFVELVQEKSKDLLPINLQKLKIETEDDLIKILTNLREDKLIKTDAGSYSEYLMKLIPICNELKEDLKCREEGLKLFRSGKPVDWSEEKINQTGHMGKMSDFPEYNIKDTSDTDELLKQVESNPNLSGFIYNINQFIKSGIKSLPMPFVVRFPSGHGDGKIYSLIGGHKRSSVAIQLGIPMKVWFIDLTELY